MLEVHKVHVFGLTRKSLHCLDLGDLIFFFCSPAFTISNGISPFSSPSQIMFDLMPNFEGLV